jgi:hypothetical protein
VPVWHAAGRPLPLQQHVNSEFRGSESISRR